MSTMGYQFVAREQMEDGKPFRCPDGNILQEKEKNANHEQFFLGWRDIVDQVRTADTQDSTSRETPY